MNPSQTQKPESYRRYAWICAGLFAALACYVSWFRWATFQYASFDLAFYVQGFHECLRGQFDVSLLGVPIMGNHAEPLIFVLVPIFALIPHPMLFVAVQNLALATMLPIGFRIARRAGFAPVPAFLLGAAILVAPAAGFVALHEFHPEALSAPLLLLLFEARQRRSLVWHWVLFLAVVACKENLALLLVAYAAVLAFEDWSQRRFRESLWWAILPSFVALGWFLAYSRWISPAINGGDVDYASLYSHLGNDPVDIVWNFVVHPMLALGSLGRALREGNLVWLLLAPFLFLPVLRPRWLLVAAPLLLQHLLSWRGSEWSIHYHYAAPLLPVFWMATVEVIARPPSVRSLLLRWQKVLPIAVASSSVAVAVWMGPLRGAVADLRKAPEAWERAELGYEMLRSIPPDASVTAPMPYLSHLAMRSELYSLHHILKGLKTLSRERYIPPQPTDFVLIDYGDPATFNRTAGFYHPRLFGKTGESLESSDVLLNRYLERQSWHALEMNALTLLGRGDAAAVENVAAPVHAPIFRITDGSELLRVTYPSAGMFSAGRKTDFTMDWSFPESRDVVAWGVLRLENLDTGEVSLVTKGLCLPEVRGGMRSEAWRAKLPERVAPGHYRARLVFFSMPELLWRDDASLEPPTPAALLGTAELGEFTLPNREPE